MAINTPKSIKVALCVGIIVFGWLFITTWQDYGLFETLIFGIISSFVLGGISFLISKSVIKNDVKFKWWQLIFYVVGWVTGLFNLLFWLIMYILHMGKNKGDPFFNTDFHKRVYSWGIFVSIVIGLGLLLFFVWK